MQLKKKHIKNKKKYITKYIFLQSPNKNVTSIVYMRIMFITIDKNYKLLTYFPYTCTKI